MRDACVKMPINNLNCYAYFSTHGSYNGNLENYETLGNHDGKCIKCKDGYFLNH